MPDKQLLEAKDAAVAWLKPVTREVMKWFRKDLTVHTKADQSPVTIADRNAEEILRKKISREFPQHGIIGEEYGDEAASREWVWTIDPIDGTRSFIRGIPLFATLLSLLRNGEPEMGIICLPALGETAWAARGFGAHSGERTLEVSRQSTLDGATLATADVYCFREKKHMKLLQTLHRRAALVRTYPDAFGHLLAIDGRMDVMVDPWAFVWDFAPCKILVEEAGGKFANFRGSRASIQEGTALVGNAKLVRQIQKLIAEPGK